MKNIEQIISEWLAKTYYEVDWTSPESLKSSVHDLLPLNTISPGGIWYKIVVGCFDIVDWNKIHNQKGDTL